MCGDFEGRLKGAGDDGKTKTGVWRGGAGRGNIWKATLIFCIKTSVLITAADLSDPKSTSYLIELYKNIQLRQFHGYQGDGAGRLLPHKDRNAISAIHQYK